MQRLNYNVACTKPKLFFILVFALNHRVPESKSGGRKFVQNARILMLVVVVTKTALKWQQSKLLHFGSTNYDEQPFIVGDVLHLSDQNAPGNLVETLVFPFWIQIGQRGRQSVVFTQENRVSDGQIRRLIWTRIA